MGGINHQPCSKYLGESTRLSRFVSLARAHFELSNVALEDVIIVELGGQKQAIGPMRHELQLSQDHLLQAMATLDALEAKMKELGYTDLPETHTLNLRETGLALTAMGMVDRHIWKDMSSIMQCETFYGSIKVIREGLQNLLKLSQELFAGITQLADHADDGTLHLVLEENRPGNIKVPFARLYTGWSNFHQMFLTSSLISTEIWYANRGFGSLTSGPKTEPAAAAVD